MKLARFRGYFPLVEERSTHGQKTCPGIPEEFRWNIVDLVRAGRSVLEISREFEIGRQTITNWLKQEDLDAGRRDDGLTSKEREELLKLRKKVRQLEVERNPLKSRGGFNRSTQHRI